MSNPYRRIFEQLQQKIDRTEIRLPFPVKIRVDVRGDRGWTEAEFTTRVKVPHRETGIPGWVEQLSIISVDVAADYLRDDAAFLRWIRSEILDRLEHEIDESIYFDGRRVFDPHDPEALKR